MTCLCLTESEIDTETERRLLASSNDERSISESPLTTRDLCSPGEEKKFCFDDINRRPYCRAVRLLLFTNIGCDTLTAAHFHTFVNNFERKGGVSCRIPDPKFDAWCLVTGKTRDAFSSKKFLMLYPSVADQIIVIRQKLHITVNKNII